MGLFRLYLSRLGIEWGSLLTHRSIKKIGPDNPNKSNNP